MHAAGVSAQDFVWLTGSLCQINRIPFDPHLLLQRFPPPHTVRNFLEAVRSLGFRTGEGGLGRPAFPCVGFLKGERPKPALIIKGDDDRLLYFAAGSNSPTVVPADKLAEHFEPALILVRHKSASAP